MIRILRSIKRTKFNIPLTLYVNFRLLPFKMACKLPIYVFGKWYIDCSKGNFVIETPIRRGMILMGRNIAGYVVCEKSSLKMKTDSKIIFRGTVYISQGCQIFLNNNAILDFAPEVLLGDLVKIICYKKIEVGKRSEITWESQIMDYNYHFIEHIESNTIPNISRPVKIGNYCWIGNRTTIMPGTVLPDRIIVTSNSLLNKDYIAKGLKSYSLIGGMPAKLIATGYKRVYSRENEKILKKYFVENETDNVLSSILSNIE
jgi:acetyltransferase-like isoleucine patch superfamily enzyme